MTRDNSLGCRLPMQHRNLEGQVLLGRYRLQTRIGSGGMGAVYAAADLQLHRTVAIKVLHATEPEQLSRFALEAKAVASLNHPHIGALLDFHAAANPFPFLVMEHIDGESLRALMTRDGALSPERAVHIAGQMLMALGAAHRVGTVHRDIKPANIMVGQAPGLRDFVKIVDFGIARMAEGVTRQHLTREGALLGTPQYMAPEQTMGRPVGASADSYAVGLCLFEMIAGYNPFAVGAISDVIASVREVTPPPLSQVRQYVLPHLVAAVARALAKDPEQRFASCEEFLQALGSEGGPRSTHHAGATTTDADTRHDGARIVPAAVPPVARGSATPARPTLLVTLLAVVLASLLTAGLVWWVTTHASTAPAAVLPVVDGASPSVPTLASNAGSLNGPGSGALSQKATDAGPPASKSKGKSADAGAGAKSEGPWCQCRHFNPICKAAAPIPECSCHGPRTQLCPTPPDATGKCPTPRYYEQRPTPGGKPGGACSGFYEDEPGGARIQGHYECSVCSAQGYLGWVGVEGQACSGVGLYTGTLDTGTLSTCSAARRW